jgi:hypothetical protein
LICAYAIKDPEGICCPRPLPEEAESIGCRIALQEPTNTTGSSLATAAVLGILVAIRSRLRVGATR